MSEMNEILERITARLSQARTALAEGNDDTWHLAMHFIREAAWEGKELIHAKRFAAHIHQPAKRRDTAPTVSFNDIMDLL